MINLGRTLTVGFPPIADIAPEWEIGQMQHSWRSGFLFLLASCEAQTQLPLVEKQVELRLSTEPLVCHIRSIADAQKLRFHYGTSEQPFGTMATFRLIGDGFELIAYNPERAHTYVVQAYDMSSNGEANTPARHAFAAFRTALVGPLSPACSQKTTVRFRPKADVRRTA